MSAYVIPVELVLALATPAVRLKLLLEDARLRPEAALHRRGGRWVAEVGFHDHPGDRRLGRIVTLWPRPRAR
jgi:hypothetical protein